MARPLSLTDERREQIEGALAVGAPVHVAAAAGGVSARTVARWLADGLIVRRRLAAVSDEGDEIDLPDDDEAIQRRLLASVFRAAETDWRAAAWLLKARWPQRFRA